MAKPITPMDSPALKERSAQHYPANYRGRVPKRIRMACTVVPYDGMPDHVRALLLKHDPANPAELDQEYDCWVNSFGAVSAIVDGVALGVKPSEFDVIEWHGSGPATGEREMRKAFSASNTTGNWVRLLAEHAELKRESALLRAYYEPARASIAQYGMERYDVAIARAALEAYDAEHKEPPT